MEKLARKTVRHTVDVSGRYGDRLEGRNGGFGPHIDSRCVLGITFDVRECSVTD